MSTQRPRTPLLGAMAVVLLELGCGPVVQLDDGTESSMDGTSSGTSTSPPPNTTVPGTTAPPPPGTTSPPPPDGTTGGPLDTGVIFLDGLDGSGRSIECDVFAQDCPVGEKCMPWANDGGNAWNATRCSPVADDPDAVGEPCLVEGSGVSGIDSCDYGAMCWNVDPETNEGTCVAFCTGTEAAPVCADGTVCNLSNEGVLILCLPTCDPLLQNCLEGEACVPWSDDFICVLDGSEGMGGPGQPCEFINACAPGLACLSSSAVPDCAASGCCSPFCSLADAMPPCLPGQVCTPWFEMAPPGYEDVGACALPM